MAIAEAYRGRKPDLIKTSEDAFSEKKRKTNDENEKTTTVEQIFGAYESNNERMKYVFAFVVYTLFVLSIGAVAFSEKAVYDGLKSDSKPSRFSDGVTKTYTSEILGNKWAGTNDQKNQCSRDLALHMLREAYFKSQEADARLPKVSMDDKGRWGSLKEKSKKAKAELVGKQACVDYLMPDVNDAFRADMEAGLTIDGKQMRREAEKMQPIRDALKTDGREGFEDQRYTQSIRNALLKERTFDPFGKDIKTGKDLFTMEFENEAVPDNY
jgi:hypothetical protein